MSEGAVGWQPERAASPERRARPPRQWIGVAVIALIVVSAGAWAMARPGPSPEVMLGADNFAYSSRELTAPAGDIRLTLANTDAVTHTLTIASLGVDLVVESGGAATAEARVRPGRYQFVCTIPGHDVPGMRGVLRVE